MLLLLLKKKKNMAGAPVCGSPSAVPITAKLQYHRVMGSKSDSKNEMEQFILLYDCSKGMESVWGKEDMKA